MKKRYIVIGIIIFYLLALFISYKVSYIKIKEGYNSKGKSSYINNKYGYSINYPSSYIIEEKEDMEVLSIDEENKINIYVGNKNSDKYLYFNRKKLLTTDGLRGYLYYLEKGESIDIHMLFDSSGNFYSFDSTLKLEFYNNNKGEIEKIFKSFRIIEKNMK